MVPFWIPIIIVVCVDCKIIYGCLSKVSGLGFRAYGLGEKTVDG